MQKVLVPLLLVVTLSSGLYALLLSDSHDFANYKRVRVGMSVDDVQALLGLGEVAIANDVPGIVVAVNPVDEKAAHEKWRRSGGPPPTARGYPTRIKPVVEGDYILKWVNSRTRERILVAFKDGKVCEKNYWDPNYL